jgi:BMFP domain-containing protein YqiC
MLSQGTIYRIYDQGEEAIVRLITRLEDRIADLEAQLTRSPQPLIASLSKELALAKGTLVRQTDQLLLVRQQNHQLVRRIRELEREIESGGSPVEKDSHNSSRPPSMDPPWKKVKRTVLECSRGPCTFISTSSFQWLAPARPCAICLAVSCRGPQFNVPATSVPTSW